MHTEFFKILSRKPENLKFLCNDVNIPLHSAFQKWINNK